MKLTDKIAGWAASLVMGMGLVALFQFILRGLLWMITLEWAILDGGLLWRICLVFGTILGILIHINIQNDIYEK